MVPCNHQDVYSAPRHTLKAFQILHCAAFPTSLILFTLSNRYPTTAWTYSAVRERAQYSDSRLGAVGFRKMGTRSLLHGPETRVTEGCVARGGRPDLQQQVHVHQTDPRPGVLLQSRGEK